MRTQKTVGNTVYNYYYIDGVLVRQTWGTNYIDFLYDESGSPYSFIYNGTQYYYVKNLQGDVMRIVDATGSVVANYSYDAWGKVTNSGNIVGLYNPIRYRGYYYDTETGFYYLQSRYYDPAIKRFISADGYINANGDLLGFNMYAYCGNNPIFYKDSTGTLRSRAEIHNAVAANISERSSGLIKDKKTYLKYKNNPSRHGFCDLYHSVTGEVWEIKRWGGGLSCSKFAARKQLENYVKNGYLVHNPNLSLQIGGDQIQSNGFLYPDNDGEGQYWIFYWNAGHGIIFYDYFYLASAKEVAQTATVAITIILLAATMYAWAHGVPVPPVPLYTS